MTEIETHPYGKNLRELATSPKLWAQINTIPNWLALSRAAGTFLLLWLIFAAWNTFWPALMFLLLGLMFLLLGLTDLLDGYLAKHHGMASDLGKILDTLADKVLVVGALAGLVIKLCIELVYTVMATGWTLRTGLDTAILVLLLAVTVFTAVRDALVTRMRLHQVVLTGKFESAIQAGRVKMAVQVIVVTLLLSPIQLLPAAAYVWVAIAVLLLLIVMAHYTQSSWRAYVRDDAVRKPVTI